MARGQVHRSLEPPEFQTSTSSANVRVEAIPKAFLGMLQPSLQVQRSASARPCHVTPLSISTCSLFAALETEASVCMPSGQICCSLHQALHFHHIMRPSEQETKSISSSTSMLQAQLSELRRTTDFTVRSPSILSYSA